MVGVGEGSPISPAEALPGMPSIPELNPSGGDMAHQRALEQQAQQQALGFQQMLATAANQEKIKPNIPQSAPVKKERINVLSRFAHKTKEGFFKTTNSIKMLFLRILNLLTFGKLTKRPEAT